TSPGASFENVMRFERGTSPLIWYVVRPLIVVFSAAPPVYAWSLNTRQTKPEQSKPPRPLTPIGASAFALVPPQTYGKPTKRTAVFRTRFCHEVSVGSTKVETASSTYCCSQPPKLRIFATEYAVSARVAGSLGRSSRSSVLAGWFVRRPSM